MNAHDLGDVVTITALFRVEATPGDPSTLTPADPTAVVLRLLDPAGTTTTPAPTHDNTGVYHADVAAAKSGQWFWRWEGTGAAADAAEGTFFVRPSAFSNA